MIDFARRFDPQPCHTDPVAAKRSVFGGLIASAWYTPLMTEGFGLMSAILSLE